MPAEDKAEARALSVQELHEIYDPVKEQIRTRLGEFRQIWESASEEELFRELVFCLLTPQSKAKTCWKAVQRLDRKCMIAEGEPCQIQEELVGVRFNQRKAEYICLARAMFCERPLRSTLAAVLQCLCRAGMAGGECKGIGLQRSQPFLEKHRPW